MSTFNKDTNYELAKYYTNKYYKVFKNLIQYEEFLSEVWIIIKASDKFKTYRKYKSQYVLRELKYLYTKLNYQQELDNLNIPINSLKEGQYIDYTLEDYIKNLDLKIIFNDIFPYLNMNPRNTDILKHYYGFYGKPKSLRELSKLYNISAERVRQVNIISLRKLRHLPRLHKFEGYKPIRKRGE